MLVVLGVVIQYDTQLYFYLKIQVYLKSDVCYRNEI